MTRSLPFALLVVAISSPWAYCQDDSRLHRVDAKAPAGLRQLFAYDGQPMPLLSAHRGGAVSGYPENCIATFEHTLEHTFSILEIDLQFTKDGHIVLLHDPTLDRTTTGTGRVSDRTLDELKTLRLKDKAGHVAKYPIPTLDEALQWALGKTIVILDKKNVPVEECVRKIESHHAEAYAMVMAYSIQDIKTCYRLNGDIMMEVMIGNRERFRQFDESGVPWNRIVAFVGHDEPKDRELVEMIHAKGACCMAGTSRNLDRQLRVAGNSELDALRQDYRARLAFGIDLIETDLPVQLGALLFAEPIIPKSKAAFSREDTKTRK